MHGLISYESFFLTDALHKQISYNSIVTQLTFVKFVILHLLAFFLESLLFLYLCVACCDHVKFLFFIFLVDIRVSGVGVLLCFVGNVFFVSDTGERVLRTLPRPTRTGGYKFCKNIFWGSAQQGVRLILIHSIYKCLYISNFVYIYLFI